MKRENMVWKIVATLACAVAASSMLAVQVLDIPKDEAARLAVHDVQRILGDKDMVVCCRTNAALGAQEWRLKSDGRTLTVEGRDGLGVAYGLYSFLEQIIGCRWYAPDVEVVPPLYGWSLPKFERSGHPAIMSREMYVGSDFVDGKWRLRNKETMRSAGGDSERSGSPGHCHTFSYYAKSLGRKDAKAGSDWFCLTDPGIRKAVAEAMKNNIRLDREKAAKKGLPRYQWPSIYELSQDDGGTGFACRCSACLRLRDAAGSWSGPNIEFASAVAVEVAKEFPDVWVRTFAYSYTEQPPTNAFRAADNLIVRYCRSFLFQPLTGDTDNGKVFRGWDGHVDRKFVWSYWRAYSGPFFPTVKPRDDIQNEIRYCRDMHVHGYFAEAEDPMSRSFSMMNHWIFLKVAENPDLSVRALADEFIQAYYGAAAKPITAYLNYLEMREKKAYAAIDPSFVRRTSSGNLAMYTQRDYLDESFFEKVDPLLEEAELLVANDPASLSHVRLERLVFDRTVVDKHLVAQAAGIDVSAASRRIAIAAPAVISSWGFDKKSRSERMSRAKREAERAMAFAARYPVAEPAELKGRNYEAWSVPMLRPRFMQVVDSDSAVGCAGYDPSLKLMGEATFILAAGLDDTRVTREIKGKEIPQDEKFHLYRIGRMRMVCEDGLWFGASKGRTWLPCFSPSHEEREFWISIKFTGPAHVAGSKEPNRILYDRLFVVK